MYHELSCINYHDIMMLVTNKSPAEATFPDPGDSIAGGPQPNPQLQLPALVAESIPRRPHFDRRFGPPTF